MSKNVYNLKRKRETMKKQGKIKTEMKIRGSKEESFDLPFLLF